MPPVDVHISPKPDTGGQLCFWFHGIDPGDPKPLSSSSGGSCPSGDGGAAGDAGANSAAVVMIC